MKKRSTLLLPLLASGLLASCTMIRPAQLTLSAGQTGKLGFQTVTLLKVLDSRCPPGSQCAWSGDVAAEVRVLKGRETKTLTLRLPNDPQAEWAGLRILNATQGEPVQVTFTDRKP
ncbi:MULTISPECIES: hypothetical protein [Deinococcus]|uniref:Uncharacterized protein n=1 Tax=Deinococcus cavernae TaxID=2320857 RepID=A0A418V829_9DEIO|nr:MULTISPECIES: hypothetical protein [Deinococcus]RJF72263.1 hypothetical protein D3875_12565 [Deinococcus cavernae]